MNNTQHVLAEMKGLYKQYKTGDEILDILDDVSLDIYEGETVAITGESGSGKSTLLNMLSGLDRPSKGSVFVGNIEVSSLREQAAGYFRSKVLGMVFQSHHLLKDFTLLENIALPGMIAGFDKKEVYERAAYLLDLVGIAGRSGHFPNAVSGGERQRAAVARALINKPGLLLADEPTGNLDEKHSGAVQDLLFDVVKQSGASLVLVTHDRNFAARAERKFILKHGKLELS
ncbi:ABC transporter ATP-binding protein [Spirochaeta dissipatitropha]